MNTIIGEKSISIEKKVVLLQSKEHDFLLSLIQSFFTGPIFMFYGLVMLITTYFETFWLVNLISTCILALIFVLLMAIIFLELNDSNQYKKTTVLYTNKYFNKVLTKEWTLQPRPFLLELVFLTWFAIWFIFMFIGISAVSGTGWAGVLLIMGPCYIFIIFLPFYFDKYYHPTIYYRSKKYITLLTPFIPV